MGASTHACPRPSAYVMPPSLDFNLHQAILSSLAASYSREANKQKEKDKGKQTGHQHANDNVTSDGVDVDAAAAPQQSSPGEDVLSRFGFNAELLGSNGSSSSSSSSSRNARRWRLSDANALIAVCEYLCAAIVPDARAERVVLAALGQLGDISVERCLGAQGQSGQSSQFPDPRWDCSVRSLTSPTRNTGSHPEWLLPDQLAFHLATTAVALQARKSAGHALNALFGTYGALKAAIEHADREFLECF